MSEKAGKGVFAETIEETREKRKEKHEEPTDAEPKEEVEDSRDISESSNEELCSETKLVEIDLLVKALIKIKVPVTVDLDVPVKVIRSEDGNTSKSFSVTSPEIEDIKVVNVTTNLS